MTTLPKSAILKLCNDDTEVVKNNNDRALKALSYIVKVYYGINAETVDLDVYMSILDEIHRKYPALTFEQLNLSYSSSVISKRVGVGITKGELIEPVALFHVKIQLLLSEVEKQKQKLKEIEVEKQKKIDFKLESEELYLECLENSTEWKGTPFQASSFAHNFAGWFHQEEKDIIWAECIEKAKEMRMNTSNKLHDFIPDFPISEKHLFCDRIVRLALERKFKLIVE